ncbi:aldehyde dehydrogenase family protein [Streptomyces sp. BI20]|uniref:aldehyde dehydrogenase family protein n=1 Tax=Streptomyces sp. BI20 TaxID=3403460 RepID=UPI003C79651C
MSMFSDLAHQYIDGAWPAGAGSWDIIDVNPYNGEKLAAITVATVDQVDQAYRAAERAQRDWAAAGPHARRAVLERVLAAAERRGDEIVEAMIEELGATRPKAAYELYLAKEFLREAIALTVRPEAELLPSLVPGKENRVHRLPVGVVCVISPFNFPFLITLKSVAPALALGNAVVVKPNQNAPVVGGGLIAALFEEAGLPAGLLNVLVTDIAEIGDALITHPVPKVISFAGSDRVGRHVGAVAARHFKRSVLELSGNSALVVLDDADLEQAAEAAVFSRFVYQGQVCMAANRILVDASVAEEFTALFLAKVRALRAGDPHEAETTIGPLINSFQADALTALVDRALADGARALLRGTTRGNLVEPTVLTDLPADSPLLGQEIFGPVALLVVVADEEEAVRVANATPYGLSGAVHTRDVERGIRFAHRIETGMMHVNDSTIADEPLTAFGGEKASGLGRLGGQSTVDAFTTLKWISVRHGARDGFPL